MVEDNDWRRQGQERYLANRRLRFADWTTDRADWGHDHCSFCWANFGPPASEGIEVSAGYVTADHNRDWICPTCFEDFGPSFNWAVVDG